MWRLVLLLGVLAACSTYGEGSASDWGALRLHGLGAGAGLAAAAYAAFALAEACGRLAGSWLLARFGQRTVLVSGGIATCAGMLFAAFAPSIPVVVAGFALAGLGVANAFPAAMTRVGLLAGPHGVAIASTLGYGGLLLGPPTIGFLAGTLGLGPSLATVSLLAVVGVAIAWFVTADGQAREQAMTRAKCRRTGDAEKSGATWFSVRGDSGIANSFPKSGMTELVAGARLSQQAAGTRVTQEPHQPPRKVSAHSQPASRDGKPKPRAA